MSGFGLPETPAAQPPPLARFETYTVSQLRAAMYFFGKAFKNRSQAIAELTREYQATGRVPGNVRLTAYQEMTPGHKQGIQERATEWIMESDWYLPIVTFIPIDRNKLLRHMHATGLKISSSFLTNFLFEQGILMAENGDDVLVDPEGNQRRARPVHITDERGQRQLTLSQIISGRRAPPPGPGAQRARPARRPRKVAGAAGAAGAAEARTSREPQRAKPARKRKL